MASDFMFGGVRGKLLFPYCGSILANLEEVGNSMLLVYYCW